MATTTSPTPTPTREFGPLETWDAYRSLEQTMRLRPAMGAYLTVIDGRPCACGIGAVAMAAGYPGHDLMHIYFEPVELREHLDISRGYHAGFVEGFDGDKLSGTPEDWGDAFEGYKRGYAHGRAAAMLEGLIPLPIEDPDGD